MDAVGYHWTMTLLVYTFFWCMAMCVFYYLTLWPLLCVRAKDRKAAREERQQKMMEIIYEHTQFPKDEYEDERNTLASFHSEDPADDADDERSSSSP